MPITYRLEFELSANTYTDLSADWVTATPLEALRGLEPGERVAGVGRLTMALFNPDGRYTPGDAACTPGFAPGIAVRLIAVDGEDSIPLFYGRLDSVSPRHEGADPVAGIVVLDEIAALDRTPLGAFPWMEEALPGDLIEMLITRGIVPPGRAGAIRFGVAGLAVFGAGRFGGKELGVDFDAGQSVFPWAGDTWPADRDLLACIADVTFSEGGWFTLRTDGTPVFRDRHTRVTHLTPDLVITGGAVEMHAPRRADRVINRAEVTVYPRAIAESEAVLWSTDHAIRVPPGATRELTCRYRDPDQQAVSMGARDVVIPVPGLDFTASTHADPDDPNGIDLTQQIRVRGQAGANALHLTIRHDLARVVYLHGLAVRGVPVRSYLPATAVSEDAESRYQVGRRVARRLMPLHDSPAVAADAARGLVVNQSGVWAWPVVTVEVGVGLDTGAVLGAEVGDRLSLTDAGLGLDGAACFIDRVRHVIGRGRGGLRHRVTWETSPAGLDGTAIIGMARFGEARFGY